MSRWAWVLLAAGLAGGCQAEPYRFRPLGRVGYGEAFQASEAALAQHFTIASADPATGWIICRPKAVQAPADRLLGSSPARQVARMQLRREGDEVLADLRVELQRQDVGAGRAMQVPTVDTQLPTRTPAQESAALPESDQRWETTQRDVALERAILADVLRRLAENK